MSLLRKSRKNRRFKKGLMPAVGVLLSGLVILLFYAIYLDFQVIKKFEGARWEIPSRVFARPMDLFAGKQIAKADFILELEKLRYKRRKLNQVGSFFIRGSKVFVHTRAFAFPDETVPATRLEISFKNDRIRDIRNSENDKKIDLWRLEPVFIGGIYPKLNEDRVLVKIDEVPPALINTLIAVEDRKFYEHFGIAPLSILRALIANIRAGAKVQGGSTLTQQLVKNFYLSNEKTLTRKFNEAIMALLLEVHYSKDEILEAYLNEVYLGQDGRRAIHGFGLASRFYFDKDLNNLDDAQIALLVGLVKGASYYDPRRRPKRAMERRQVVQGLQLSQGIISEKAYRQQIDLPLTVSKDKPSGTSPYPNFLDLVKRQLREDYDPKDLRTAGLQLYTTLDPITQHKTEQIIKTQLHNIESSKRIAKNSLQVAAIISDPGTGLIRALVGGRNNRVSGFNRVLDSERQVGSLIKPVIYLTALEDDTKYYLNSVLEDAPISITMESGEDWIPENYDKRYHGDVSLLSSLANSYNAATVRLGLNIGVSEVIYNLNKLGIHREIRNFPSLLLGAVELNVFEVAQVYQTLATQGYRTPLRAINMVAQADGKVLSRYPLVVQQEVLPEHAYLILRAMQTTMREGTGRSVYNTLPASFNIAGKTGTTNDYRDSWFTGITGDKLAVVWIGADDNRPIGLSGSSGAMRVWTALIAQTKSKSLKLLSPEKIEFVKANILMQTNGKTRCVENFAMPVVSGKIPSERDRISCTND